MSFIKVVDMPMGQGKTSAVSRYIAEHPERRYLYISTLISEADRLVDACARVGVQFEQPQSRVGSPSERRTKSQHLVELLRDGKNVASTHAMFQIFSSDMVKWVDEWGYTLIVDEALQVFAKSVASSRDIDCFREAGFAEDVGFGELVPSQKLLDEGTDDGLLSPVAKELLKGHLVTGHNRQDGAQGFVMYYRAVYAEIEHFEDVFVMTYMFEHSDLRCLLQQKGIEYRYVGITNDAEPGKPYEDTVYKFCHLRDAIEPEIYRHLRDYIIVDTKPKRNAVGDRYYDLSHSQFMKHAKNSLWGEFSTPIRNAARSFMRAHDDVECDDWLLATYRDFSPLSEEAMQSQNRTQNKMTVAPPGARRPERWIAINTVATNNYSNCTGLIYLANLFSDANKLHYFANLGIELDGDMESTSTLIQWIWRSAIRNGRKVYLFLPSSRMRKLLFAWMDNPYSAKAKFAETDMAADMESLRGLSGPRTA